MRKHFIRFLIISICFSSCQENEKYKNENLQLFENNEFYISDSVQKIIIISEQGCHSCNKTLYDFFQSNKKNPNCYYIINALGTVLDLSEVKNNNDKNFKLLNSKDKFFNETKIIMINNKKIDTIIKINAQEINAQISYINKN